MGFEGLNKMSASRKKPWDDEDKVTAMVPVPKEKLVS